MEKFHMPFVIWLDQHGWQKLRLFAGKTGTLIDIPDQSNPRSDRPIMALYSKQPAAPPQQKQDLR